jgi:hypothetical protein
MCCILGEKPTVSGIFSAGMDLTRKKRKGQAVKQLWLNQCMVILKKSKDWLKWS